MHTYPTPSEPLLTVEEFERYHDGTDDRLELVRGRIVREPPANFRHGQVDSRLAYRIRRWVDEHGLGEVVTNVGFVLSERPATVRGPDIAFVSRERIPAEVAPTGFARFMPDLAVEILSPSNTASDVQEKVLEYLEAGVRLIWIVDPRHRRATVYRSRSDIRLLSEEDHLDGDPVLPGFTVALSEVLAP